VTNAELSELLSDSLDLWGVIGQTRLQGDEVHIATNVGHTVAICRLGAAKQGWSVQIMAWPADEPAPARLVRACASVVPMLRTIRALLSAAKPESRLRFASERPPASGGH
jgi:hypothetical protein